MSAGLFSICESRASKYCRKSVKKAEPNGSAYRVGRMDGKGYDMGLSYLTMSQILFSCSFSKKEPAVRGRQADLCMKVMLLF